MRATLVKIVATAAIIAGLSATLTLATWSAFSSTAVNSANSFATGTVTIADDDSGSALFSLTDLKPSSTSSKCINVTYSGSLTGLVRLYRSALTDSSPSLAGNLDVVVTRGSFTGGTGGKPVAPNCSGGSSGGSGWSFAADSATYAAANGVVYTGTMAAMPTTYAGSSTYPAAGVSTSTVAVYKIDVTVNASTGDTLQGKTVSGVELTWEAQSS